MTMQKLIVRNFGPIKNVELDINDFMVFIGPQSSGKSTLIKMVLFHKTIKKFHKIFLQIFSMIDLGVHISIQYSSLLRDVFQDLFDRSYINDDFFVEYRFNESFFIQTTFRENQLTFTFSPAFYQHIDWTFQGVILFFDHLHERNIGLFTSKDSKKRELETERFLSVMEKESNRLVFGERDDFFIPSGRNFPIIFPDRQKVEKLFKLDSVERGFMGFVHASEGLGQRAEHYWNLDKAEKFIPSLAAKLAERVLKGKYQFDPDGGKIITNENKSIPVNVASSGQQDVLWMLNSILECIQTEQPVSLFLEEPETHLFPETQKELVDLIALFFGASDNQAFITTHSPYILTSLNNLLYAHRMGQKTPEAVEKIIPRPLWLEPQRLSAYFVEDGGIRDILDREEGIIRAEEIDNASRIINTTFDQLLELEQ